MRMDPIQNDKDEEYIPEDVKIEHTASVLLNWMTSSGM
jgi:hypothetical protein